MKRLLCIALATVLAIFSLALTGCDDNKNKTSETKSTEISSQSAENVGENEIQSYLDKFTKGKNDLYGAWRPKDFDFMTIIFRNDNLAELVSGENEGYFSKYTLKDKSITLQLMPNVIDGTYKYSFSQDKNTLTLSKGDSEIVLIKQKNFTIVPKAPKKPTIDTEILGWWENEDGAFYCFQENGVMYENSISMECCYTYSAEDGKIKAVYNNGTKDKEDFTYSVKDGNLILNGTKFTKKGTKV
ncbi:MAG: hypothetical protein IJ932_03125 [Ruminococcus sp.]|nr:hypothetical protein [Ruminococcus sp.]